MIRRCCAFFLSAFFLFLSGCVISPRRGVVGGGGNGNGTGHLYVSDQSANAILTFAGATGDNGNISPTANISGGNTLLSNPQYIFSDATNDRLYVANAGGANILVFNSVSTLSGNKNIAPGRAISSPNLSTPVDVALDRSRDRLYVADVGEVAVFSSASTANGSTGAAAVLRLAFTPSAVFIDSANDRLFVADTTNNNIDVFDNASTLNGTVTAPRILGGPTNAQLNQPNGIQIDGAGRLIVSNAGSGSIKIYSNAATINGDQLPATIIAGNNTTLVAPAQLALDPTTNSGELYVADPNAGEVAVFSNITTAGGSLNATPNRKITGPNTLLSGTGSVTARGVGIDTTH